ncbi:TPM domain-containing protein [Nitrosomonas sp.]|uniref:TPM domain-containing protein n=1 Tax=Nitrosomonas sp. TaxID=42353 RepID=UPI0025FE2B47|nr:TPM domain-containing protein [Nitrosomonas sp.]
MNFARILRHLLTGKFALRRIFHATSLTAIEQAIQQSEMNHGGQICFAVEATLNTIPLFKNQTARERAVEVFSQLRIWDTEHNNGVLIYLLLADRDVEIIADRGIHAKVSSEEWEAVCRTMESAFRQQQFEAGVINGINAIGGHLREYFPSDSNNQKNEIANKPVVLE